jgi:hypothetical protein
MATYELYFSGPRQQNIDWAIYPSAPFSAANPAALPPANKTPVVFGASRTLDFTNDTALAYFLGTTLAAVPGFATGDIVGAQVLPSNSVLLGLFWSVNTAGTSGLTFSLQTRIASHALLGTTSGSAIASGWTVATLATGGTFFPTPDIVDLTFVAVPGGGIGAFAITITPVYFSFQTTYAN